VFVHGAAHDHSVWALQSRYFAHHGFDVLAVDLPGHGRSGASALGSVEAIAQWIVAVLDAVGAKDAALVGHSMGALAVLECAARHPERVRQLALLGPAVPMEVSDALMEAAQQDEALAFELINGWSFSPGKQLGGNQLPGVWLTGNALQLMHRTQRGVLAIDLDACRKYAGGLDAAAAVRCPSLVLLGARDLMAPARNAKALLETLPNVRAATLPECGHSLMSEQPDAVLDALRAFLVKRS
jgi:pimeloyl-ACP methyl ester carboxylesterase